MKTVNLYGESGIVIYVNQYGDIETDPQFLWSGERWVRVVGRRFYACSLEEAHQIIRDDYMEANRVSQ